MARATAAQALTEVTMRALGGPSGPGGPLPALFLCLPAKEDGTAVRSMAALVRMRSGGFMVALPDSEEVSLFLQSQEDEGSFESAVALYPTEVLWETPRGRALGEGGILLADLVWSLAQLFIRGSPLRAASLVEVIRFTYGDQVARPNRGSVEAAADQWIHETMDEDTAADYVTIDGGGEPEEEELVQDGSPHVIDLQRRVQELEEMLAQQASARTPGGATSSTPQPPRPRGVLFDQAATPTTGGTQTLEKLRQLAGAAPLRLGAHEKTVRATRPSQFLETLQQEETLEAVEPPEMEEGLAELEAAIQDPMQRMLLLQMKQLQLMTKQQEKKIDPLHAALGGSETSGGGSGIKGCLARDAYVRLASDVGKVGSIVQNNAAVELGLDPHQIGSGLMREYLEKRCPLGDNRLLTQFGYIFAAAWEHGFRTNNHDLLGHASRGMLFIDQAAMDYGRTNLAWLLTSLPEPQYSITQRNRHKASMSPFTRLAQASWIAANVSYMKDLDYLEGRIKTANSAPPPKSSKEEGDEGPAAKKQPWKKKKQKQKEDGSGGAGDQ